MRMKKNFNNQIVFWDFVVNSQRFGNELKTAEDNLRKDLRGV